MQKIKQTERPFQISYIKADGRVLRDSARTLDGAKARYYGANATRTTEAGFPAP